MEDWEKVDIKFDMPENLSFDRLPIPHGYVGENFMISGVACPYCGRVMAATLFPDGYWISTEDVLVELKGVNTCERCYTIFGAAKVKDSKWDFFKFKSDNLYSYATNIEEMNRMGCAMHEDLSAGSLFGHIQRNY